MDPRFWVDAPGPVEPSLAIEGIDRIATSLAREPRTIEASAAHYVGRFAPSPTGPLHAGSLHAAVISWLDARAAGGRWLLRIEDLDPPRTIPGADASIRHTLLAHGLQWDAEVPAQSSRNEAYAQALLRLQSAGRTFRCVCSRRTLREHGPVYPGTCRERNIDAAEAAAVRFRTTLDRETFADRVFGYQNLPTLGDFVIRRRDGLWAYQLAVVVDDAEQQVTDVVRGSDLLDSTPRQLCLHRAFATPEPRYLHHGVLLWPDGAKLSKQTGAPAVEDAAAAQNIATVLERLKLPNDANETPAAQLRRACAAWRRSDPRLLHRNFVFST